MIDAVGQNGVGASVDGGVVLVGTPETLEGVATAAMSSGVVRSRLVGAVVVEGEGGGGGRVDGAWAGGVGVLGAEKDLRRVVEDGGIGTALVCLPLAMRGVVARVERVLRLLGVEVRRFPTVEDAMLGVGGGVGLDLQRLVGRAARPIDAGLASRVVRGKRVLITGAGGSIGSELARLCAGHGPEELILMERSENALFEIDRWLREHGRGVLHRAVLQDVVQDEETRRRLAALRPETVFHAAAHKHVPLMQDHPAEALRNNLFGTKSVVDAALACGAERFVLVSTDKAVRPRSVMGATKQLAERYVRSVGAGEGGMRCGVVRFGNVLGSASSVLPIWESQMSEGGPMTVTDARMTRYFMTIPEAAALVVQAAAITGEGGDGVGFGGGEVFVLDMGEPVGIVDLARRFAAERGLTALLPGEVAKGAWGGGPCVRIRLTGARPGEKLHEELAHDPAGLREAGVEGVRRFMAGPVSVAEGAGMADRLVGWCESGDSGGVIAAIGREVPDFFRSGGGDVGVSDGGSGEATGRAA